MFKLAQAIEAPKELQVLSVCDQILNLKAVYSCVHIGLSSQSHAGIRIETEHHNRELKYGSYTEGTL